VARLCAARRNRFSNKIKKPGTCAGLFSLYADAPVTLSGGFLFLLPIGIELNHFGHEFVTQRFQVVRDLASGLRQPATAVGGLDKKSSVFTITSLFCVDRDVLIKRGTNKVAGRQNANCV
jgi:hypothetical protein